MGGGDEIMSETIDERIIDMQFNNKQFESGIQTSIKSLDNLNRSLADTGGVNALSTLQSSVQTVANRFTAMGVIATTTLMNITNSAINTGTQLVKSFTIDPIKMGFREYETQINAVQTILANTASKGTTLNQVNAALDQLNTYADKTIYNFTEMTRNIGTFTAAGVDLDVSVQAIKGIANLAAVSGSNAQQASTAMYQLSQAIAAGTVKLMDWNSVVNAGMGGQVFQDALMETARVHGVAIDSMIKSEGSFRETLSNGWLTSDILLETLNKFTGDMSEAQLRQLGYTETQIQEIIKLGQMANNAATEVKTLTQLFDTLSEAAQSGWTQTWKIIIGDFGEAKELLTDISNTISGLIGSSADARNKLLTDGLSSGWKQLLSQGIADEAGYKDAISEVAKTHNKSLEDMIEKTGSFEAVLKTGWLTADMLTESLELLTSKTRGMSDEQLENIGYTRNQIDTLEILNTSVQNGSLSLDEFADKMTKASGRENLITALRNSFEGLVSVITPISTAFREIFPPMVGGQLYAFTENVAKLTEKFKISSETADNLKRTFSGLFSIVSIGQQLMTAFINGVAEWVGILIPCTGGLLSFTASIGDFITSIDAAIKTSDVFNKTFSAIRDVIKTVVLAVKDDLKGMLETPAFQTLENILQNTEKILTTSIKKIGDILSEFGNIDFSGINNVTNELINSFTPFTLFGNILSGAFDAIHTVLQKFMPVFTSLASIFGTAFKSLGDGISKTFNGNGLIGVLDVINGGLFATILLGIKSFIDGLSDITNNAGSFLEGITNILDGVKDSLEAYQSSLKAKTLITIASAIAILAAALTVLSLIDSARLLTAIGAMSVLFVELSASMQILSKSAGIKGMITLSISMVAISTAILILSGAMENLAGIDWDGISKGIIGIGLLMTELKIFVNSVHGEKLMSTSVALIAIGAAMNIMVSAVKGFGELDITTIVKGITTLGVVLGELALFINIIQPTKLVSTGIAMIAIGSAMLVFAEAIGKMGSLSLTEIGKGLLTMAGTLTILTVAIDILPKNMTSKAASLLVLSTSLTILANVMSNLGGMTWEEIAKSLVALAGSLTVITIAMQAMTGGLAGSAAMLVMATALTALIPALKILGNMQLTEIGTALLALAGVFTVIGVAGLALAPLTPILLALSAAVALLGVGVLSVGAGLLAFAAGLTALSIAGASGAAALVAIVTSLLSLIPLAATKMGEGIIAFASVITNGMPAIMDAIKAVFQGIIQLFGELTPSLLATVFQFIDTMLTNLVEYTPKFIESGSTIILGLLTGISEHISDIVKVAIDIMINFIAGVTEKIPEIAKTATDIITVFLDTLGNETPKIVDAGFKMIIDFINGLAEAIRTNTPELIDAVINLGGAIIEGLVNGLLNGISSVIKTIKSIGQAIIDNFKDILGIHSPSRVFTELAGNIIDGLVNGLNNGISTVKNKAKEIGTVVIDGVREKFNDISSVADDVIAGLANGLQKGTNKVADAAKNLAASALNSAKSFLDIHSPSRVFQKEVGQNVALGMAEGMDDRTDKVAKSAKKMSKTAYDNAVLWINNYKNSTDYLVSEELKMWEILGTKYKYVSKEKIEIDKNVLALQKELAKEKELLEKESFDNSKNWINEKKKYQELSLLEEVQAWERVQARYTEGTELRKEADYALFDAKKRLLEEEERLLQSREDAEQRYTDAVENRTNSIYKTFGLFETLKEQETVSSKLLVQNLQDQVGEMRNWSDNLIMLSKRGIEDGLIQELQNMGPSANAQIKAMVQMTDAQLNDFQLLWKEKMLLSRKQAVDEMQELRIEVSKEVAEINKELSYLGYFDTGTFTEIGAESINALIGGYNDKKPEVVNAVNDISKNTTDELTARQTDYKKTGQVLGDAISDGLQDKKNKIVDTATNIVNASSDTMNSNTDNFYLAGSNAISGFIDGMNSKIHDVIYTAASIAQAACEAVKSELDIHSPSRVFMKLGEYTGDGLVIGLSNTMRSVSNKAELMGRSTITSLSDSLNDVSNLLNADDIGDLTIRPVIDLTNIQNGMDEMNRMFSSTRTLTLDTSNANATSNNMNTQLRTSTIDQIGQSNVTINNNFDCTGMTVRNDSDIDMISNKLYTKQQIALRGRGQNGFVRT